MPPDLNSLPPSRSTSSSPLQQRNVPSNNTTEAMFNHSPRSSSVSLAAAATMNAADHSRHSSISNNARGSPQLERAAERRRSAVAMNLNLNDPAIPGPGELSSGDHRLSLLGSSFQTISPGSIGGSPTIATGDPHHQRAPSLGEIHQELEQEQEAQVNRLLIMIRAQQAQLQQLQNQQPHQSTNTGTAIIDDSTPTSERSASFPSVPPLPVPGSRSSVSVPMPPSHLGRRGSRHSSQATSPALRPLSGSLQGSNLEPSVSHASGEWLGSGGVNSRDESAYYQAETQMLTRENQMLRLRIRELERQLGELSASPPHAPPQVSNLAVRAESISDVSAAQSSEAEKT